MNYFHFEREASMKLHYGLNPFTVWLYVKWAKVMWQPCLLSSHDPGLFSLNIHAVDMWWFRTDDFINI